jgi:hypothetical protein
MFARLMRRLALLRASLYGRRMRAALDAADRWQARHIGFRNPWA